MCPPGGGADPPGTGQSAYQGDAPDRDPAQRVVRHGTGIRESAVLSHVVILDVPAYHKLMFITDGGMVVIPDLEQKRPFCITPGAVPLFGV